MKFQYRVQGKVKSAFVIRGLLFRPGYRLDFCVDKSEIDFIKLHCSEIKITDLCAPKEEVRLEPMPEILPEVEPVVEVVEVETIEVAEPEAKPVEEQKEIKKEPKKDELHTRPRSTKSGNKSKGKSKVSASK